MRSAVLRASGDFDADRYLAQYGFVASRVWRAGESAGENGPRMESGFNLAIAEARSTLELMREIRVWVAEHSAALGRLIEVNVFVEIDVGLTVGAADQYTASIAASSADLALLAASGVSFRVSAYPASEDDQTSSSEPHRKRERFKGHAGRTSRSRRRPRAGRA